MDIAIRVLVDQLLSQPDGLPLFWQIVLAICLPLALMMSVQALM